MNSIKLLTIMTFTFCSILTTFGQNGLKEGNYFLLLKDKENISLNTYEDNKIKEKKTFAISEKAIFTTDQKERVAILDTARNSITLYEIQTSKEIKLSIPYDLKPKTILINEDNLFIGGEMGSEMLIQYHIQSDKWYQLEIPTEVLLWEKAIDDLLINDSLLIAIDNIVLPKYILFYQLNTAEKLALSHFKALKSNAAYESIYQGRISLDYLALRSSAFSANAGNSEHITIYKGLDLTKSFAISTWQDKKNYHTYNDFLIIGNKVIIASKENGLGVLKIKNSYFKNKDNIIFRIYSYLKYGYYFDDYENFNREISASKISYIKYKDENIIRLTQIPNTAKIVLTIENSRKNIRYEIVGI